MRTQKAEITKKWLYHKDTPQGELFDLNEVDEHELKEAGWLDSPKTLAKPAPPEITKAVAETLSIEDLIAKVKAAGFIVLTGSQLEAKINQAVNEASQAIKDAAEDKKKEAERAKFERYEKTFFETPTELTKPELIEYALKRSGGEIRLAANLKEQTMIDKITEWLDKARG